VASGEQTAPPLGAGASGALARAVRAALRPLVRLLIARQLTFPQLASLLKSLYVEVAEQEFPLSGKRQTDSRIHLLTGVHRKDVRRLRGQQKSHEEVPANVSLGAQLVGRWSGLPQFLDSQGLPRPLPLQAEDEPSFESLVRSLSTDIGPRSVLDEWLRLGVVHYDTHGRVVLDQQAFVPQPGLDENLFYLGRNLRDHASAAVHNVLGEGLPVIERSTYYARLRPTSVEEIEALAKARGEAALRAVNQRALELQRRDEGAPEADQRISFGVYFYAGPTGQGTPGEDSVA